MIKKKKDFSQISLSLINFSPSAFFYSIRIYLYKSWSRWEEIMSIYIRYVPTSNHIFFNAWIGHNRYDLMLEKYEETNMAKRIPCDLGANILNDIEVSFNLSRSITFIIWITPLGKLLTPFFGEARRVMVIVVGNGHGYSSSNPGRDWLHFT